MSIQLKLGRLATQITPKVTFRVVTQKSPQSLVWRGIIGLHLVILRFFCTINMGCDISHQSWQKAFQLKKGPVTNFNSGLNGGRASNPAPWTQIELSVCILLETLPCLSCCAPIAFALLHSALFALQRFDEISVIVLFAVGVIALFAFLMCFALLRKVFCIIAQSALRYCAKCIKNAKMQITQLQ